MNRAATIALAPLSGLYGAMMAARRAFYRTGIWRVHRVNAPVISVGNITIGGTGKTPLVEWIAREFARRQRKVCILTRGYGRRRESDRVIVSDGEQILADARAAGDEPLLLAESLQGEAAVVCDADRVSAARWAIKNLGSNLLLLDDGFQHLRLARDFNIAVVDATNPWGNRRLLPAGILRESLNQLVRADCLVITRADDPKTDAVQAEIVKASDAHPVFRSRMKILGLRRPASTSNVSTEKVKSIPSVAFCAIGNPESFFAQLRRDGFVLSHTETFRDHYRYTQADIDRISRESLSRGAQALLTTAKDQVKLRSLEFKLPCYVLDIEIEIHEQDKLLTMVDEAIARQP